MGEIERIGAVARLGGSDDEQIEVRVEFFADLKDGRRIVTDEHHGGMVIRMRRRGLGAIARRYYGPPVASVEELDATYRVGITDVEDAVRETAGLLSLSERRRNWASLPRFLLHELSSGFERDQRRTRWAALRAALGEEGIVMTRRKLDHLPFSVEIADNLAPELAPRSE